MSRLRWPDSTNSVSDVPGTIQACAALDFQRLKDKGEVVHLFRRKLAQLQPFHEMDPIHG